MPIAAFDTMGVAERLSGEFDFPDKQARGIARVMHDSFVSDVATKEDIAAIRKDSRNLEEKLGGEIARFDQKIDHMAERLIGKIEQLEERLTGKIEQVADRLAIQMLRQNFVLALGMVGLLFAMMKLFL